MRQIIIAGNWKMNKTNTEALELIQGLLAHVGDDKNARMVVCPPYTALSDISRAIEGSKIYLGAQNVYFEESGAYTGEIAPSMLLTIGVTYVIIGHSERREYFSETDSIVNDKVKLALKTGLIPIVCVGEKLEDRENGKTEEVVGAQIDGSLEGLDSERMKEVVIAYEPVWAIGTGKTASPEMAQDVHWFIRKRLHDKFGDVADEVSILYGGSMKGSNAAELIAQPDIDGGLIGGASLKAEEFLKIINSV
ncbi:MAG: triose-phosphate isomerase [Candidatus Zixiibacteriota bacterium]|nr:MAG: triose-phosphate isomerase [candidate division Zixibacteria bacterium]HHI02586.1 triose-phosphate isomerase [candidate division Zixibacteria bacterium]